MSAHMVGMLTRTSLHRAALTVAALSIVLSGCAAPGTTGQELASTASASASASAAPSDSPAPKPSVDKDLERAAATPEPTKTKTSEAKPKPTKKATSPAAAPKPAPSKDAAPKAAPQPSKTAAPKPQVKAIAAHTRYATSAVNMRSTPSASGNQVTVLPAGAAAKVNGVSNGWYQATYQGKTGFVAGRYLAEHKAQPKPAKQSTSATSNTNTSTGKKAQSAPAPAPVPTKKQSTGGSFKSTAAGILSRYGCGGAPILINDGRLGSANGAYDFGTGHVLLKSSMPSYRIEYVVAHECMHQRQSRAYGGNIGALTADMNAIYGGSGYTGLERNADCMTRALGISVTNAAYASSCSGAKSSAAQAVLAGQRAR